jgi:hypothetical protein
MANQTNEIPIELAQILPTLGRSELDVQLSGAQFLTTEDAGTHSDGQLAAHRYCTFLPMICSTSVIVALSVCHRKPSRSGISASGTRIARECPRHSS